MEWVASYESNKLAFPFCKNISTKIIKLLYGAKDTKLTADLGTEYGVRSAKRTSKAGERRRMSGGRKSFQQKNILI